MKTIEEKLQDLARRRLYLLQRSREIRSDLRQYNTQITLRLKELEDIRKELNWEEG